VTNQRGQVPRLDTVPGTGPLLAARRFFTQAEVSADGRSLHEPDPAEWDRFYRDRWAHDKVVRSTHGVNCTGSCSWQVFVKDGLITWEHQATDYPSAGPDSPEYEPRGCPRGASFSWYAYSPSRVRYPYVRGVLLQMWREARARLGDPVAAWAEITGDPGRRRAYQRARGKGGFVRASWDRGTKVVAVSPDYADNVKFADDWLAPHPGTDGALAMAMGHVILTEFFRDRQVPYFTDYARRFTDLPFLVTLERGGDAWRPGRFLTAADLGDKSEHAEFKPVVLDEGSGAARIPNGSLGFRWGEAGAGRWNLDLGDIKPLLSLAGRDGGQEPVALPRFDEGLTEGGSVMRRGVPVTRVGGHLVTTVFDLLLAQYGVHRDGLPGDWPTSYQDASQPYTPAWGAEITSVPARAIARIAREFARNAERTRGPSMIAMGAGTNHWFHSDQIYRAFLSLVLLTGCQGVNGGWAHYVGQEKVRPLTGFQHLAFAFDWQRPTRRMAGTPFWYLATDQWRYEGFRADELASPLGSGAFAGRAFADCNAQAVRLGWTPSHPAFNRNPLDLADEAAAAGVPAAEHVVAELKAGRLRFAAEDPGDPVNFPRVLTVWRPTCWAPRARASASPGG
jgi:nitrate reductase alpha subunit